jgi:plasmid maintenance system killer protein
MIKSFRCRDTEQLFDDRSVPRFGAIERAARRKLLLLHRAARLDDLRAPPGRTGWKRSRGNEEGNTIFASTISGGSAFTGTQVTPTTSRSWTTIAERIGTTRHERAP